MQKVSTYYLRTHEVVRALSITEFVMLCTLIDEFGPKRQMLSRHGNGSDLQTIAGVLDPKQFRILSIIRNAEHNKVLIFVEHEARKFGATKRTWYEVQQDGKRKRV